jgi:ATP-dependent 26S proteasome regulatory subunit
VATEIRAAVLQHNVFRGQVLSFGSEVFGHGQTLLQFHRRPTLTADQLVLHPETLAEVQRQVVEVARHKGRLLAAGQHLKRGLLLYGPPGTGKTHTVRYLTSSLVGTTVLQLTGNALHLVAEACSVARALQPAMLVIEDVDLIAEDRGMHPGEHPLLFQLLNEMDGLAEDADVVFVLTTNRADLLEPALAARPGRVDQAVVLELPDADARRALFELYRGALPVDTSRLDDVLARTEGVTASFLKELLRRAALLAATRTPDGEGLTVSADDLAAALDELLDTRNAMTRTLLGSAG